MCAPLYTVLCTHVLIKLPVGVRLRAYVCLCFSVKAETYECVCEPSKASPKTWILKIFSPESHLPEGRDRVHVDLGWGVAVTCRAGLPLEDSGTPSSSVQALKECSIFVFRLRSRVITWRWWTGHTGTPLAELQGLPA